VFAAAAALATAGAILISFLMYMQYRQYVETSGRTFQEIMDQSDALQQRMNLFRRFLPEWMITGMTGNESSAMRYVGVMNFSVYGQEARAVVFENVGGTPLSAFVVTLDGRVIDPYYAPDIVMPNSRGIVVLQPEETAEWHQGEGILTVSASQGVSIAVRASNAVGMTGGFVYALME